jgi:hypothetical protein
MTDLFDDDDPLNHGPLDDDEEPELRDRREHGGAGRPDDEELARRTEEERVDSGVDAFDPDSVPPATDEEPEYDPALDEELQEERGVARRQQSEGELYPLDEDHPFPPTGYEE